MRAFTTFNLFYVLSCSETMAAFTLDDGQIVWTDKPSDELFISSVKARRTRRTEKRF